MAWTAPKTMGAEPGTSPDWNTHVRDNLNYLKTHIALEAATLATIAGGVITYSVGYHKVDTQGAAAEDDLDTIGNAAEGLVVILRAADATHTVVLKDGTGNLVLGGDIYLDDTDKHVMLVYNGAGWILLAGPFVTGEFTVNIFQYPAPGTDWTPQVEGAGLAANLVAKKCWLPLNFLKLGDEIVSYKLVGDAVEAAALTLDCKLVRVNKADPLTTTDIAGGGIVQVDADGNFDVVATLGAPEVVATDKQYTLEILGTTGAGDALTVMGAEVMIRVA